MLDHVILNVKDVKVSRAFYQASLSPLGYRVIMESEAGVGFGIGGKPDFWIARRDPPATAVHVAFHAARRTEVDAFHAAALGAGGRDHGKPGLRPHYHPAYYGAFILDPDGNNIEAVCHDPKG